MISGQHSRMRRLGATGGIVILPGQSHAGLIYVGVVEIRVAAFEHLALIFFRNL